jgi:hypothetical protein
MDVPATTATATLPPITLPGADPVAVASSDAPAAPTPTVALLPPAPAKSGGTPAAAAAAPTPKTLATEIAKLFGPQGSNYSVSFRTASGSDQIVVVVTDTATGQTVSQFPSETLIALAQFFDKLDASVVDKKA